MGRDAADQWESLDGDARANLSGRALDRFFQYRDQLKAEGETWDSAQMILTGFIWNELDQPD